MVIIKGELLPKREEIQNEMSLLLERVSPSSRILMDILKFYSKSRSHFGLQSSTYLLPANSLPPEDLIRKAWEY